MVLVCGICKESTRNEAAAFPSYKRTKTQKDVLALALDALAAAVWHIDSCASEFIVNKGDKKAIQDRWPAEVVLGGVAGEATAEEEGTSDRR